MCRLLVQVQSPAPPQQKEIMKTATIEILEEGETIFGSPTNGEFFVRRYEDGEEMGGGFFKTIEEAETSVREYQRSELV